MILKNKNSIRRNVKFRLSEYKNNFEKDSELIFNAIKESSQYKNADTILSYMALQDEVNVFTEKISLEKKVFIPKVNLNDLTIEFYEYKNQNNITKGAYNISEPDNINDSEIFNINHSEKYGKVLILVPGRSFTTDGKRLGRGKGFYDKYLEKVLKSFNRNNITIAGVCFKPQIEKDLPADNYDIKMDMIFTTDK